MSSIGAASLRLLRSFAEAARQRSFARAAQALRLSPSAVAKNVARLEQQLGLRLFQRTTRRVTLTQEGEAFFERCARVLDELHELELLTAGTAKAPSGTLRIDVPVTFGKKVLLPLVAGLARRHPQLNVDVRLSDQYADVVGSGVDAVVRVGKVAEPGLVARTVAQQQLRVYGSPDYFARRGRPRTLGELERHDCVVFRMPTSGRVRPWEFVVKGRPLVRHPPARYAVNDGEGMASAARAGLGIVQLPDLMAEEAVAAGQLEETLAEFRPRPTPISVVFPTQRHMPMRLRAFIDALSAGLP
ncbi:MAG TPA: LysR substrate-binding domain-containing protein [Burkholderiales bacterium]